MLQISRETFCLKGHPHSPMVCSVGIPKVSELFALRRRYPCSSSRRMSVVVAGRNRKLSKNASSEVSVSVPSSASPPTSGKSLEWNSSWTFVAALSSVTMLTLALTRFIFRKTTRRGQKEKVQEKAEDASSDVASPLSSGDERSLSSLGPLLFAAETGAQVDGTSTLSDEDLEKLDFNLRMLVTNMDAQLSEVMDEIVAGGISPNADAELNNLTIQIGDLEELLIEELNKTMLEGDAGSENKASSLVQRISELQWKAFEIVRPFADDSLKRRYRALLTNRDIQSQLLHQVERESITRSHSSETDDMNNAVVLSLAADDLQQNGSDLNSESSKDCPDSSDTLDKDFQIFGISEPHPGKAISGGEDAFFVVESQGAFGVADGVGGWSQLGVDPAEYPRKLMQFAEDAVLEKNDPCLDPAIVLRKSFTQAHAPGSCTVTIATLCPSDQSSGNTSIHDKDASTSKNHVRHNNREYTLKVASLGDCAVRVIRNGSTVFATQIQEHSFNQPFQLSSPQYHSGASGPDDAIFYSTLVRSGDVIVMGSDGLFDNLWDHELEHIIQKHCKDCPNTNVLIGDQPSTSGRHIDARKLALELVNTTAEHSRNIAYASPFAAERHERTVPVVLRAALPTPTGGKLDDITVVVCIVS